MEKQDLLALGRAAAIFNDSYLETKGGRGGGTYIAHGFISQRLIEAFGFYEWRIINFFYDENLEWKTVKDSGIIKGKVLVGVQGEITVTLPSGKKFSTTGCGDVEHPNNWGNNGTRLKDAESDALKRTAKNLGVGLQVWSFNNRKQIDYFLHDALIKQYKAMPDEKVSIELKDLKETIVEETTQTEVVLQTPAPEPAESTVKDVQQETVADTPPETTETLEAPAAPATKTSKKRDDNEKDVIINSIERKALEQKRAEAMTNNIDVASIMRLDETTGGVPDDFTKGEAWEAWDLLMRALEDWRDMGAKNPHKPTTNENVTMGHETKEMF